VMLPFAGCGRISYLTFEGQVEKSRVDEVGLFGGPTGEESAASSVAVTIIH
jgi:hypothetical protein